MNDQGPRYAIYFVPPADSKLYQFGRAVLQYDCYSGEAVAPPDEFGADGSQWRKDTEEPRRYGFHATMKAPFRLSRSHTEAELVGAFGRFVAPGRTTAAIRPVVRLLGSFVAIVPEEASAAVDRLAADCTAGFDAFRAPMPAQERARRLASNLTPSQIENLDRWGYPYVLSEFRFHMTLTGRIERGRRDAVLAALRQAFDRRCGSRVLAVNELALLKQERADAGFRVIAHAGLKSREPGGSGSVG